MAKKEVLKERYTNEVLYPITHEQCIETEDKSGVASKQYVDSTTEKAINSTPRMYQIDFIQGVNPSSIQEYNMLGNITIIDIQTINISNYLLFINSSLQPDDINGIVIHKGDLLTWEITKNNEQLPASIGIKYTYNEN